MNRFVRYKKIAGPVFCAFVIAAILSAIYARILYRDVGSFFLRISMISSVDGTAALYLDTGDGYSEREVITNFVQRGDQFRAYDFPLPRKTIYNLRFDPLEKSGEVAIKSATVINGFSKSQFPIRLHEWRPAHQIKAFDLKNNIVSLIIESRADDPQIAIPLSAPLSLDSFSFFPLLFFMGYLSGGFLIFFIMIILLILALRRFGILVDFFEHPGKTGFGWIKQNKLFLSVIIGILAFRIFFVLTYPLDTCSDAGTYYRLMRSGMSTLVHATGYPYIMHFFSSLLPTKTDVLLFQHCIDFGTQLILMIILNKRFGLVAAVTAGVFYGLELRTINWVSRSTPEWLQGVLFVLAFVGAIEAYFTERPVKKISLYVMSAWLFSWSVLVKFLTAVMLPIYLILFMLEMKKKWNRKWLCFASMCIVFVAQFAFFVYLYHFPSTGTKTLTHDVGWVLNEKTRWFLPAGHHFSESGPWSKRYCILISEMPGSSSDINIHAVYRHVDTVPRSIRKHYQERYRELSTKSDPELQEIIKTNRYAKNLEQNFLISNYYLGLAETDDLLKKVFLEAVLAYPKDFIFNVINGIKDSFFIKTSYYIAIIHRPFSSNQDHPFQLNGNDVIHNLPWGYALFNVSRQIRCMYDQPIFLKAGLGFFTSWGESVYIPTIIKWFLIVLAMVIVCIGYGRDKTLAPAVMYLSMGTLAIILLIFLSNVLFAFRDKEYQVSQHLLSILAGISVCSIVSFGKMRWFGS